MSKRLIVDSVQIHDNSDCYVIAEVGHNHQGSLEKAKELFCAAKECGAHAVKLQKRDNHSLYTRTMYNKPYQTENSFGRTYGEHRELLEFGMEEYVALKRYAQEIGITFFATAFDITSANFLAELDMPAYKIASGDLRNLPLIMHVASFQKPIIISTGGATIKDVQRVYEAVMPINPQLCLLQCTSTYPARIEHINLRVISTFREYFPDVVVGFSDHSVETELAATAYALGARVIEKHFTLDRSWKGTDHAFSLEPAGMCKMIDDLRRVRLALSDGVKRVYLEEMSALLKMGKALVAAHDLPAGHYLTKEDIAIKSPGEGLPPFELDHVVGRRLQRPLYIDTPILFEYLNEVKCDWRDSRNDYQENTVGSV